MRKLSSGRIGSLALAVLLFAGFSGCNRSGTDKEVMAKVNGYKVLRSEVDKTYNAQIAGSPQKPTAPRSWLSAREQPLPEATL